MNNLYEYLTKEYNAPFQGWDFSYIKDRMIEDKLNWNYKEIVEKYLYGKETLLDMDTGGGEFLCSLSNLPTKTFATEGYEPNIAIAKSKLKEKSIELKPIKTDGEIPFEDNFFDIIINRHGDYEINELKRTLKTGGLFITQQVGGLNGIDINMAFEAEAMEHNDWCLIKNMDNFQNIGMEIIDFDEKVGKMKFNDIGAFVYYLKCIPWQVKDFTLDKYYKKLVLINEIIERKGSINFLIHRFYLIVRKN